MFQKPIILIHVEDRRRDALVTVLLAKLLKSLGNRVFLCNRATNPLYWRHLQPDVMLTPFVWTGVSGPEELAHRAKTTRIIVWPTEGMVTTGEEWVRDYAYAYDPEIVLDTRMRRRYSQHLNRVLLWGNAAKNALVDGGVLDDSQVTITGCPRLDFFHPEIQLAKNSRPEAGSSIGFVGGFPPINPFDQRSVFATIDGLRSPQSRGKSYDKDGNLEDLIWWYFGGARLYMELLDEWILGRRGTARFRPHPFEYFGSYKFLKGKFGDRFILDDPLNPFPLWLDSVAALVINRSTSTMLPAFFDGKPVITVQGMIKGPFAKFQEHERYNTGFVDHCYKPETIGEAADMLEAATKGELPGPSLGSPDLAELLRYQLDWPRDNLAISTAAREIDFVAKEAAAMRSKARPLNLAKVAALPYVMRMGVKWRARKHRNDPGWQQTQELSNFWPWHRYEWHIGEVIYRTMESKMRADLAGAPGPQPIEEAANRV